jgi:two-component system, oxyanion-binding sensor
MPKNQQHSHVRPRPLRLGFVPLNDCAPIVMARELELFSKYGINVELSREVGWATVRDKIIYGELDAAHAPAGMVIAASAGLGSIRTDCLTGLVINLHGNAITLSQCLWRRGVRDVASLKDEIERLRGKHQFTFGVVFPFSSHNFLLRSWLRSVGIDPDRDVRIVVVPPPQMFPNLKAGNLDGYCVGEPWNSVAVMNRAGFVVATSNELVNRHPEKVLMVRSDFATKHEREHLAMIAALIESCRFCDVPENRERIIEMLAEPQYLNAPIHALRMSMKGSFDFGNGRIEQGVEFHIFSHGEANEPDEEKAAWVMHSLHEGRAANTARFGGLRLDEMFRADIYRQATRLNQTIQTNEKKHDHIMHRIAAHKAPVPQHTKTRRHCRSARRSLRQSIALK